METYKIYCGGSFKETKNPLKVACPYSGQILANTFLATPEDLEQAVEAALAVEKEMAELPTYVRSEALLFIAQELKNNRSKFAEIISKEAAKPWVYAFNEVDRAIQTFTVAAEEVKRLPSEYISLDWTAAGRGKEGVVKYFPIGLVAGISPFNFPLNLAVHKIAPAIAAGNPIILKPASKTPLSTLELAKIIDKSGLPKGAVSILPMDRRLGNSLVTDERIKMLSFTGSPEVGWQMKQMAGKKKVLLELGGNAAAIITETADLELAMKKLLVGGYAYSGQVCIHTQRVFIHESIFDEFVEDFVQRVRKLTRSFGEPFKKETLISVMIGMKHVKRVEKWVNESVKQGAKVLTGGEPRAAYFLPTVMTNTRPGMKVWDEEIFGPVVLVEPYSTFEQAVEMVNNSKFGLQASVFTNNYDEISYAFNNIEVGGLIVNDITTFRVDHMPYGGVKDSGFGREGLKYSIREQMEPRLMVLPVVR